VVISLSSVWRVEHLAGFWVVKGLLFKAGYLENERKLEFVPGVPHQKTSWPSHPLRPPS
jgi:hypothetical protein